jgi:DNA-directed RNA polymerase subunit RPC12/RpoP
MGGGFNALEPAGIDSLKIFGFQKGDDMPGWSQDVSLVAQPAQQPGLSDVKYTEPELVPTNRAISITLGILGLVGSLMFFIIPVIGWVIGALGVIGSLGFIGNGISGKGTLKGECPYCGADVSAMENMAGTDCTACKKRILIKDNKFWQTE